MLSAMSALPQSLKEDVLVAQNPAPQIISTVSISVGSNKPMATATIGQPSVVPGHGTTSMDKHALANVCVVVEVFPPNAGGGSFWWIFG
jgi:hypothetical protein